jgi:hypothetical protein
MTRLNGLNRAATFRTPGVVGGTAIAIVVLALASAFARGSDAKAGAASASQQGVGAAAPIYGIKLPPGYRDWTFISMARVGPPVNDMRAKLGNEVAIRAYREGKIPFPDGTIIARLAYNQATSEENNAALGAAARTQGLSPDAVRQLVWGSFVAGPATNVQLMVKDARNYASTGGWGFAQFTAGKPDTGAVLRTCFPCHAPAKDRDFVFTSYAP